MCVAWFWECEEFLTSWNLPWSFFWSVFSVPISELRNFTPFASEWRCVLWECLSSRQFVYRHHTTCRECRRKLLTVPGRGTLSELLSNGNLGELRYDEVNLCRCTTLAILVTCYLGYMYPFKVLPLTHGLTVYLGAGGHNSKVFPNGRACHCHCQGSMNSSLTSEHPCRPLAPSSPPSLLIHM